MAVLLEIQEKKKKEKVEESLWRLGKYDREKGLLGRDRGEASVISGRPETGSSHW